MDLEVMTENKKALEILKLLEGAKEEWNNNESVKAIQYLKTAREFYESLDNSNNGEYKYLKKEIINTIEELNEIPINNNYNMKPNELEKRLISTIDNLKNFIGDKEPEEMSEEERKPIFKNIIKAGEYYKELTKSKGKNYRVDLLQDLNSISDKFLEYES